MSDLPQLFTVRQTAHALGIKRNQVFTLMDNGTLTPHCRLPGARGAFLFHADDIAALLASADQRKRIYRARRVPTKYPMNGLQPVRKRPYRGRGTGL